MGAGRAAGATLALCLALALSACKHDVYPNFKPPLVCETEAAIESR